MEINKHYVVIENGTILGGKNRLTTTFFIQFGENCGKTGIRMMMSMTTEEKSLPFVNIYFSFFMEMKL